MHIRKEIKARVVEMLIAPDNLNPAPTIAGNRVYKNRYLPLTDHADSDAHLPAICVWVAEETADEPGKVDWTQSYRYPQLVIDCYVTSLDADDMVDLITNQVERIMMQDETLRGLVAWCYITKTELLYGDKSDSLIQGASMTYECKYLSPNTSTLPVDDFDRTSIAYRLASGAEIASDDVEMPQ
jgi:hypothetical protein